MKTFITIIDFIALFLSYLTGTKVNLNKKETKRTEPPPPDRNPVRPPPDKKPSDGSFKLSARSKKELVGVNPQLVKIVKRAIEITEQDFGVHDGKRTAKEQNRHFQNGASQLDGYQKKSYHQTGNAVDLVPWINGQYKWDWDAIYHIAEAMKEAAAEQEMEAKIRWGGVWDRRLHALPATADELKQAVQKYVARQKAKGKDAFIDGPHFEIRS